MISKPALRLVAALLALGCASNEPPPPAPRPPPAPFQATAPPAVTGQAGEGPIQVYGASVYSPGQEIYKQLRQEDSLMAFLACQGEPDRVEVIEGDGDLPRIVLEYSRSGLRQRGTVEIAPSAAGYYAAQPIDPSGRLSAAKAAPARKKAPPPKSAPQAKPKAQPAPEPEPEAPAAEPAVPEPTPSQIDECPIEPWRSDCRGLCVPGADWEWCSYRD